MAESGDWVTPRLYGKPWFEKPPLLYWGGAIFFKLLGEGHPEVAARLPSAISALLATLALAWLAWRTYGEECARWLLLLLPTSIGMIGFSHAAATDMPFAGMLTIAMVCAAAVLGLVHKTEDAPILPRARWLALILFGFFLGLAVLAKGPAAIILCGGAVFFWAIFTKRWRDALRLLHPAAIAVFCATALPWYILCARRNPDFFRIFIVEHNFKRYLTPEFQHIQPFWFYGPVILIAILPWTAAFLYSAIAGTVVLFKNRAVSPATALVLCWAAFPLIFFSISHSKLPGYILPTIPPAGLLLTRAIQASATVYQKLLRACVVAAALVFGLTSAFFFELGRMTAPHSHLNGRAGAAFALLALLFSASNLLLVFVSWSKSSLAWLRPFAAIPVLGAMLCAPFFVNAPFQWDPSGRSIANELRSLNVSPDDLFLGHMERGQHYSLNFYLHQEIPDWDPSRPAPGYLLLRARNCTILVEAPYACGDQPIYFEKSGRFLYQVRSANSLPHPGAGRQPRQEK